MVSNAAVTQAEMSTQTAPLDLKSALSSGLSPSGLPLTVGLRRVLRDAMAVMCDAVRRYGVSRMATAFNGGKDATVVLHLARAAASSEAVQCMYLVENDAFPEVDTFVRETARDYGLALIEQEGGFKHGIKSFVEKRGIVAFVMGTRRSDPGAHEMSPFSPSTPGWAEFMRVNPILDWEYNHVWEFLRAFNLPYCKLYDEGYTSIGNVRNTLPNPALCVCESEKLSETILCTPRGCIGYNPAWKLVDPALERAGREPLQNASGNVGQVT